MIPTKDLIEGTKKIKSVFTELNAKEQRARAYLKDLVIDGTNNESKCLDATDNEIYGNELKLEILRKQQFTLKLLIQEAETDAIFFSDSLQIAKETCDSKTNDLLESRCKFSSELEDVRKIMIKLHETSSNKELDLKISKLNDIADILIKLSSILENKKLLTALSNLSGDI